MGEIMKTRSISDAQIQFVSLVDKAANKKSFLIAKSEDGKASFSAYGKIVKNGYRQSLCDRYCLRAYDGGFTG